LIVLHLWALGRSADADFLKAELGEEVKVVALNDMLVAGGVTPYLWRNRKYGSMSGDIGKLQKMLS
jgi:hypothetical protein